MSIVSGIYQASATESAAKTQAGAADRATQLQEDMYKQMRDDQAPWRDTGGKAVNVLSDRIGAGPGEYQKSPYYDFLMKQGTTALERGAAAKGKLFSGAQGKALTEFGMNTASGDYDNWLKRWYQSLTPYQSLAGLGQTAGAQTGFGALQTGQAMASNAMAAGNALAAGQMGSANTLSRTSGNSFNNGLTAYKVGQDQGWWGSKAGGGGGSTFQGSALENNPEAYQSAYNQYEGF